MNGDIAVVESGAREIRVFNAAGQHVRTYGRPGEGPGEFQGLARVFEYGADSVVAWDYDLRRATIFAKASDSPRVVESALRRNFDLFGVIDRTLLLYSPDSGFRPDLSPGRQWTLTEIIAMDATDGSTRVIAQLRDRERLVSADGNAPMPQPLRYAIQAVAGEGFYWATPDRYEIGFYDPEGNLTRILRRPVEPRAVESSMIRAHVEARLERVRQAQGEDAVRRERRRLEEQPYGDEVPLFSSAFVDRDQRLWVGRSAWPADEYPSEWSLFSSEGIWLGDIEAPDGVRVVDARGDLVLGIWHDEFDVPYVQLHRLVQP